MAILSAGSIWTQAQKQFKEGVNILESSLYSHSQFYKWLADCVVILLNVEWFSLNLWPSVDGFIYFCVLLLSSVNLNEMFKACSFANKGT